MTTGKSAGRSAGQVARGFPPQHQQRQPGIETEMRPLPASGMEAYVGSGKLRDKVALITGGDSGIGRAVAIAYAKEGADVAIVYLDEHEDAQRTRNDIEAEGRACVLLPGDIGDERFCASAVDAVCERFGRTRSLPAMCFSPAGMRRTCPDRCCIPTAARSSTVEQGWPA